MGTDKRPSNLDGFGTLKGAYNDDTGVLGTEGWLTGKVGRKVELEVAGDTEVYTYSEDGTVVLELTLIYTDSDRETLESAERTA